MLESVIDAAEKIVRDERERAEMKRRPWSAKRVAEHLASSTAIVRWLVDSGKLVPVSWHRPYKFAEKEVLACIARCRNTAPHLLPSKIVAMRQQVPGAAVYFLMDKGKIVYVGQSTNPLKRIGQHIADKDKAFTEYAVLEMHKNGLNHVERKYISEYQPKYNRRSNPNAFDHPTNG